MVKEPAKSKSKINKPNDFLTFKECKEREAQVCRKSNPMCGGMGAKFLVYEDLIDVEEWYKDLIA